MNVFLFKLKNFIILFIIIVICVIYFEFFNNEMKKNSVKICGMNINIVLILVIIFFVMSVWIKLEVLIFVSLVVI